MKEMAISEFKAKCLAVLEEVNRTGNSLRVTKRGKPIAEVNPVSKKTDTSWFGCMEGKIFVVGDIVAPALDPGEWDPK